MDKWTKSFILSCFIFIALFLWGLLLNQISAFLTKTANWYNLIAFFIPGVIAIRLKNKEANNAGYIYLFFGLTVLLTQFVWVNWLSKM